MHAHPTVPPTANGRAQPQAPSQADGPALQDVQIVPVIEERLKVSRRSAETGHATRVRKVVRERVQDVELPIVHDDVHVERVPVGRPVDGPIPTREEGGVLVIPVLEERLVLRTELVLREEIRITRRRRVDRDLRQVRLRAEVAIVERFDPATRSWTEIDALPPATPPRNTTMYTVIGAFDDRQAAQRTYDTLIVRGFPRGAVDLQTCPGTMDPTSTSNGERGANAPRGDDGILAGVRHFFASLFGSEEDRTASQYYETVRRGGSVVVVDANDQTAAERAAEIMRAAGGTIDLDEGEADSRPEAFPQEDEHRGVAGGTAGAMAAQALADEHRIVPTADSGTLAHRPGMDGDAAVGRRDEAPEAGLGADRAEGEQVMPVVQEEARVGKRQVQGGGVRVIRRVTETPFSELVRLRDERARIERRPADRAATPAELEGFREDSIEVRERREEPVVEKVARVVEEVVVGREVDERTERVDERLRRTDVQVDRLAGEAGDMDEASVRERRAAMDDGSGPDIEATDDEDAVSGGPNPPPGVQPRDRSLGEKLRGGADRRRDERRPGAPQ